MTKRKPIYLDYAASTPVDPKVIAEMLPYFSDIYANPSNAINDLGVQAQEAIDKSIEQIKDTLNAHDYKLIFTSGATESINTCLKSIYLQNGHKKNQIITCKTEHKAVLSVCKYLEELGAEIKYLSVDCEGNISTQELKESISKETLAVTLMHVNNETGVIHDIETINKICNEKEVPFICDATQAVGKLPIDLQKNPIDFLCFSGHKIYAPKGIGALLIRKTRNILPIIHGGGQQHNYRSGTLNVPGIVAIGKALELTSTNIQKEYRRIERLQKDFEEQLVETGKVDIIGSKQNRSPFISNLLFKENHSEEIIFPLRNKLFFSTGSACTSEIIEPSHVLTSMGIERKKAERCLRFSFGTPTSQEEINSAINLLNDIIQ